MMEHPTLPTYTEKYRLGEEDRLLEAAYYAQEVLRHALFAVFGWQSFFPLASAEEIAALKNTLGASFKHTGCPPPPALALVYREARRALLRLPLPPTQNALLAAVAALPESLAEADPGAANLFYRACIRPYFTALTTLLLAWLEKRGLRQCNLVDRLCHAELTEARLAADDSHSLADARRCHGCWRAQFRLLRGLAPSYSEYAGPVLTQLSELRAAARDAYKAAGGEPAALEQALRERPGARIYATNEKFLADVRRELARFTAPPTQEELADRLGCDVRQFRKWQNEAGFTGKKGYAKLLAALAPTEPG